MNALWVEIFFALVFFFLSGAFAASETGLVSLSRPRLKKLISQQPHLAHTLAEWLSAPQYLLTTILIGATLSNVVVSLLSTEIAFILFPAVKKGLLETATWILLTPVMFLFADFLPKSLARHYPQTVTLATLRWVAALTKLLTPTLRAVLGFFGKLFPDLDGVPVGRLSVYTLEEIREMIRAGGAEGQVGRRSMQMMERVIALNRIPVAQIMTPFEKVEMVNLGQDTEAVLDQVAEAGRTRVPAWRYNPRKIGGYLHVKDLLLAWRGVLPLQLDILLRQPIFIPPTKTAGDLLEEFRKGTSHLAVIVTPEGTCEGIITLEDVLEEVVGEILDEYDLENPRGVR